MFNNLFRPKWQHRNAAVRARAITEGKPNAEECFEIARDDVDLEVRSLAVKQITSMDALLVLTHKAPELRKHVIDRLGELLLQTDVVEERMADRALKLIDKRQIDTSVARDAIAAQVRLAAIKRIDDELTLKHSVLNDKSLEVRRVALQGVSSETALTDIAKAAKGSDKAIARIADLRLEEIRSCRERAERRQAIIGELEKLSQPDREIDENAWQRLLEDWKPLQGEASDAERTRFDTAKPGIETRLAEQKRTAQQDREHKAKREQLLQRLTALENDLDETNPVEASNAVDLLRTDWKASEPLSDTWAERRLQDEWREKLTEIEGRVEHARIQHREARQLTSALEELEQQMQRGDLSSKQIDRATQQIEATLQAIKNPQPVEPMMQRLRSLPERMQKQYEQEQKLKQSLKEQLEKHVLDLEQALQAKTLDPANEAHKGAIEVLKKVGKNLPSALHKLELRLHRCEPQLRELQSWRQWGNDHAREELVEEAKALAAADLQLEQRSKELHRLRERWKSLGGDGRGTQKLWKSFDAACNAAYEPIKAERAKETETRKQNLEQRATVCSELESLAANTDWTAPDWRGIDKQLQSIRRQWREIGGVPHKAWKGIKKRFDKAIADLDHHLEKERRHNFLQRKALVEQAQALLDIEDTRTAVAEARTLREAWQVSVTSKPGEERKLWQAFNKVMDKVFSRDRAARDEFKAGLDEQRSRAEALCEQLEKIATLEDTDILEKRGELAQTQDDFRNLDTLPKAARQGLERRFDGAVKKVKQRFTEAERAKAATGLQQLYTLHRLCDHAEALAQTGTPEQAAVDELLGQWEAAIKPDSHKTLHEALATRFSDARKILTGESNLDALGDLEAQTLIQERICTDLEILRGVESPESAKPMRMARQVEMLEDAMKGGEKDKSKSIRTLQMKYLGTGATQADRQQALHERFMRLFP